MNKRHIRYLFLVLVVAGFPAHAAFSQLAWTDADCYYNGTVVNGYASVSVGYEMGYYYDTSIALVMYDPYNNIVAAETNYTNGYSHAHDDVDFAPTTPGIYTIRVYVDVQIYYSDYCGWIDYWGFSHIYQPPVTAWDYYELEGADPVYCLTYAGMALLELLAEDVVPPTVTISGSQSKNDGDNAPFHVTVVGGTFTITGYTWAFTYPSGAGNTPEVTFSPQGQPSTSASCKWFASPNIQCPPDTCTYTIGCTVTFAEYSPIMDHTSLTVSVPWDPGGERLPTIPFSGTYNTPAYDPNRHLYYLPGHSYARLQSYVHMIMPQATQFYTKIFEHENVHVHQYDTGGIFGDLWLVQSIWDGTLKNLTALTQPDLVSLANDAYADWRITQGDLHNARLESSEIQAWAVSDQKPPFYLWQSACR